MYLILQNDTTIKIKKNNVQNPLICAFATLDRFIWPHQAWSTDELIVGIGHKLSNSHTIKLLFFLRNYLTFGCIFAQHISNISRLFSTQPHIVYLFVDIL